jgi:ankyrin repeat protein
MILCAGGRTTTNRSVEYAIQTESVEVLGFLLSIGAHLSKEAIGNAMQKDISGRYVKTLLAERQDIRTKRAILVEAIKSGARSTIVHLFKDETSNQRKLFQKNPDLTWAIESCCEKGHIDILRFILEKSSTCGVSISPMFGRSLCMAVSNNHDEIVDAILSAGMDVSAMANVGHSALLAAIKNQNKRVTEILINAGAILKPKNGKVSGDILIAAIQWEDHALIKNLIEGGADVNAFGDSSAECYDSKCSYIRPLTAGVMRKDFYLINYLISAGAEIESSSDCYSQTMTTLSAAVRNQDFKLVDFLLRAGANPYDARALEEATNNFRLLQVLLAALLNHEEPRNGTNSGIHALDKAMEKQDQVMVRAILNSPLKYFKSIELALEGALLYDSSPDFEVTRMLLLSGADPNSVWEYDSYPHFKSPLFVATSKKSPQKVQLLLDAGAQADKALTCGMPITPMQLAVSNERHDIVRKLLDHKADPNAISQIKGCDNMTPIQIAVRNRDIEMVRVLLQYNADPNAVVYESDYWLDTPLQRACKDGSKEIIELLLVHGADVNATPAKNCTTALQIAATKGFLGIAYLLLKHGADVNAPAAEVAGRTALEGAAEHGRVDMVQLFFNAGAGISGDGRSQYESAMRRASENGHHATRRLLESYHG